MSKRLLLLCMFLIVEFAGAQTQFWSDNFEAAGAPSSGTRTPEENGGVGGPPNTSYFRLTDGSTVSQSVPFTGKEGTYYWAGEDHNAAGTGFTASGAQGAATNSPNNELSITWTGINIVGRGSLIFKGLLAANSTNQPWDNTNACNGGATTNTDYIIVQYRIDNGTWTDMLRFFTKGALDGKYLFLETTGDQCGDGQQLLNVFQEFSANITGTGSNLDLRINVFSEGNNEEWGADNFRLFSVPTCSAPVITGNPATTKNICSGSNTTFSVTATGATTYKWQVDTNASGTYTDLSNGGFYSGVTTNILTITGINATLSGYRYRAVAINAVATCFTNSNYGTLNVSNITTTGSSANATCATSNNGVASVTASGGIGGYTYVWSPSGGSSSIASGLAAGNYMVTVTDGAGCTATRNYTITAPSAVNLTSGSQVNVNCFGNASGSASVTPSGGTPGYTYSWSPSGGNGATASGLAANTYTVTVTDATGCTASRIFTITQPDALTTTGSSVNVSCTGGNNGSATVVASGGTSGYTYSWSPSGGNAATANGLTANTYTCTLTDMHGCNASRSFTITAPQSLSTIITHADVSCFGGSNGTASVSVSGGSPGYSYDWSPGNPAGDGTASVSGLAAGNYSVLITDTHGCTITQNVTISAPPALSITAASQTNVSCNGGSNGAASVNTPTGGTAGYTYDWTPGTPTGDGTASVTGLQSGTYICTITDAHGCTVSQSFTITQPQTLALTSASQTNVSCHGGNNGAASVNVATGGTSGYTYNWTPGNPPGDGTISVTGLTAGTWSCIVTDSKGCTATQTFVITEPSALGVTSALQNNVNCNGGSNGSASVGVTGGTGSYSYNWTPGNPSGDGTASVSGLTSGTWTCTITDVNGCTISQNFNISQPTVITVASSQTNITCHGLNNGTAAVSVSGGSGSYFYTWFPSGGNAATATGLSAGNYICFIFDTNGCSSSKSFIITEPVSTAWNGSSWSNGIPVAGAEAVINADYNTSGDISACTFIVNGNAVAIVSAGNDLNLSGPVTVAAGANLIIENNANLLQSGSGYTNSGNITVKRNAAMRRLDYVYWGSPVAGQDLKLFSPYTVSPTNAPGYPTPAGASRFYTMDEVSNSFVVIPEPLGVSFAPPKGYMLRAPNDFPANGTQAVFSGVFKGVPGTGDYPVPVTCSGTGKGFNMLGNPYPSAVSANLFLQQNPGELYFWAHVNQAAANGANYATYTTFGTASAAGGAVPDGSIAIGQGFLLKTPASGTATFTNTMRTGNNSSIFFKETETGKHRIWLDLSDADGLQNQILIGYMDGATQAADISIDAPQIETNINNISSLIGDEKFNIQARGLPFSDEDEIPLSFNAIAAGNFTVATDHFDGLFADGQDIFLKDNFTGVIHDIKTSAYDFSSEQGIFTNRFSIVFQNTTLHTGFPETDNNIVLYKMNGTFIVNSGNKKMTGIKVFDIRGRLIYEDDTVNSSVVILKSLKATQQLLLFRITTDDGKVSIKKGV